MEFNVDSWIGLTGLILAVLAIPLSYYLSKRARQKPVLRTLTDFDVLMSPDRGITREALSLAYDGQDIRNVSRTNIAFWNARGDTLRGTDIADHDRLRLQLADEQAAILQVRTLSVSREACLLSARLTENPREAVIDFDFLDEGDGFVIEALHTGTQPVAVVGTLRGATLVHVSTRVDLTPPALELLRQGYARQLWQRIGGAPNRPQARPREAWMLRSAVLSMMAILLITLYLAGRDLWRFFRGGDLANPEQHDLSTREGQSAFAQAVADAQGPLSERSAYIMLTLTIVMFFVNLLLVWRIARVPTPRTIVSIPHYKQAAEVGARQPSSTE